MTKNKSYNQVLHYLDSFDVRSVTPQEVSDVWCSLDKKGPQTQVELSSFLKSPKGLEIDDEKALRFFEEMGITDFEEADESAVDPFENTPTFKAFLIVRMALLEETIVQARKNILTVLKHQFRKGRGRPLKNPEAGRGSHMTVYLSDAQKTKLKELGGSSWIQQKLMTEEEGASKDNESERENKNPPFEFSRSKVADSWRKVSNQRISSTLLRDEIQDNLQKPVPQLPFQGKDESKAVKFLEALGVGVKGIDPRKTANQILLQAVLGLTAASAQEILSDLDMIGPRRLGTVIRAFLKAANFDMASDQECGQFLQSIKEGRHAFCWKGVHFPIDERRDEAKCFLNELKIEFEDDDDALWKANSLADPVIKGNSVDTLLKARGDEDDKDPWIDLVDGDEN